MRRNMVRVLSLLIMILLVMTMPVLAVSTVEREYSFSTASPDGEYEKDRQIRIGGRKYRAVDVKYETLSQKANTVEKRYEDLANRSVPQTIKKEGEVYTLEDASYTEKNYESTISTGESGSPAQQQDVEVHGKTVRARLKHVNMVSAGEMTPFSIPAVYYGDKDVDYYVWKGVKIPAEEAPYFDGYQTSVLFHLGLDASSNSITGISWSSGFYKTTGGRTARNAVITGYRKTNPQYEAVYEATLYEASARYTNGQPGEYTYDRKAIITYEPVGLSLFAKIGIAAGIGLFALTLAVLLYFLAKRRKKKKKKKAY